MKDIIILITLFIFFSNPIYGQKIVKETDLNCISEKVSDNGIIFLDSCKIVNIKETKSFYLIYFQKNIDCIYKIISEKTSEKLCDSIFIGGKYKIQMKSAFYSTDDFFIANPMESQGVLLDDEIIEFEEYPVVRNLYTLIKIQKIPILELSVK